MSQTTDKEKFTALVDELTIQLHKDRTTATYWGMGKLIDGFTKDIIIPVNHKEIVKKLSNSIDMSTSFWSRCVRFYYANPNGEYKKYPLWVCSYFLKIKNRSTRKILTVAYDKKLIRNRDNMRRWRDIIEYGKIKPLLPLRLSILELLQQGDETTESLVRKIGINNIYSAISILNKLYGYNIVSRKRVWHLIPNDSEREKMLSDTRANIKECTEIAETEPDIEEPKNYGKQIIGGKINDYDFMYQKRIIERKFWREIADELDVDRLTLRRRWGHDNTLIPQPIVVKIGRACLAVEHNQFINGEINNYDFIHKKRIDEKKYWKEIANELGVNHCSLYARWVGDKTLIRPATAKNHIVLSKEALENLDGLMLGDGSIRATGVGAWYVHNDSFQTYIKFLSAKLNSLGLSSSTRFNRKNGVHFTNVIWTKSYSALLDVHNRFYLSDFKFCPHCEILFCLSDMNYKEWQNRGTKQNGRKKKKGLCRVCPVCGEHDLFSKIVPLDIELTPTLVKRWYEGDGNYHKGISKISGRVSGVGINLYVCAFLKNHIDLLVEKFKEVGIECMSCEDKTGKRTIQILKKSEMQKFFDYMGNCEVDCYKYKWPIKEELEYQRSHIDWSELDLPNILKLRKAHYSWNKIGEKYGISYITLIGKVKKMVTKEEFSEYRTSIDWSSLDLPDILRLRKAHYTWNKIGEKYVVSGRTLRRKVKRMVSKEDFLEYRTRCIDWSGLDLADVLRLRKAGYLWRQIGEKYGVSGSTLREKVESILHRKEFLKYQIPLKPPMTDAELKEKKVKAREYQIKWRASRLSTQKPITPVKQPL